MNLKYQFPSQMGATSSLRLSAWWVGVSIALLSFCSSAQAQFSNVEYFQNLDQSSSPSATDILSRKTTVGRFGPVSRGGWLSPSPDTNRRFNAGAVYTPSGGFIGLSTNSPNSRFQSWWNEPQTLPQTDYSVYTDFLSIKRGNNPYSRMEIPTGHQGTIQQRQASTPSPLPYPTRTVTQDRRESGLPTASPQPQTEPIRTSGTTGQVWMRDSLPGNTQTPGQVAPQYQSTANRPMVEAQRTAEDRAVTPPAYQGTIQQSPMIPAVSGAPLYPMYPTDAMRQGNRERLNGTSATPPGTTQQETIRRAISPQDSAQSLLEQQRYEQRRLAGTSIQQLQSQQGDVSGTSIQSSLEQMLVRSPAVKPLSPIQVQFRDGIATVRGVVPSQTHRVEAGRVLLSDPRVKTVDNQLTVLPTTSKD